MSAVHRFGREEITLRLGEDGHAEADELLLAYSRQAEALGISAVNLLSEALIAEHDVLHFERRSGASLDWNRFARASSDLPHMTAEDWRALDVLTKILSGVPRALGCWRVRYALSWLRTRRFFREEKDLPPELKKLLRHVGNVVADPPKLASARERRAAPRRAEILTAWGNRDVYTPDRRAKVAEELGLESWDSLARIARRYLADKRG